MINIKDLRVGDDIHVISKKETGVIIGLKKKKNSENYLVTVEFDDGEEFTTSLDNLDEPRYRVTPLGLMYLALCNNLGDDFINSLPDSNNVVKKIFEDFMEEMTNSGFLKKSEAVDAK